MRTPVNSPSARRGDSSRATDSRERSRLGEAGETLVEVLLALIVLGMASVALLIAFSTTIAASAEHRRLATADIVLSSSSEQAISAISADLNLFQTCQPLSTYQNSSTIPLAIPAIYQNTYTVQVTNVQYWSGSQFVSTCTVGAPQMITVTVTDASGHAYTNTFVVNYPLASSNQNTYAGAADHLVFLSQPPATNTSGVPFTTQPTVEIVDASGNIVTTDLSPVLLSLASGPSGAVLTGCSGNELSGVVYFTGCAINTAGTYTLEATDGTLTPTNPTLATSFTVSGSSPYIVFTSQPVAGLSGSSFTTQPAISVYSGGAVDTSWSGTVSLSASGGVLSSGCASVTITNGVGAALNCTFMGGYLYDPISNVTLAIPYTMTATASGLIPATSNAFSVKGPGPASQLVFSTQPTGVASGSPTTAFATQPVVTIEDAFGNVATSSSPTVSLAISAGETLAGCTSTTTKGVVSFSGCSASAYASGITLTATSSGLTSAMSANFNVTGLAATLAFTTQPVAGVSGGALPVQPVVTIYDAGGLVVTASTAPLTLTPSGGALQYCTGLTPVKGVVTVSTCTFAGLIGTQYTMTATQGSLSVVSNPFSPTDPGLASQLAYTTAPVAGAAGSALATEPVLKVEDSAGNVVTTSSAPVVLTASGGTLAGCNNLMAVSGVVNVAGCTFGGFVGTPYTLTASSPGLSAASSIISPSGPGPATTFLATSGAAQSATVTTTFANPLVATLTDNWDNGIAGIPVTFTAPSSGASATFAGGVVTATTNAAGQATSAAFTATQVAGTFGINASTSLLSATFTETNTAQRTNDTMTILQGNGQSTTVGTAFGAGLQVQILDQYANPVSNMAVSFAGPTSGASATFAPCSANPNANSCTALTDVNGDALASALTANHLVGTYSVSAGASGVANASNFSLTNLVGTASQLLFTANPTTNQASATTNVTLNLQLADQYGNPTSSASAQTFTISTTSIKGFFNTTLGGSGTLGASTTVTIPAGGTGSATLSYGDEKAATPTITALNGSSTWGTANVTVTAGPATTLIASSGMGQTGRAGLNFANPLVATVTDAWGNPVSGYAVTFTAPASGASATFSGPTAVTITTTTSGQASSGTFTANHTVGTYAIAASASGLATATFAETNVAGVAANITVSSGSGQSTTVGTAFASPLVALVTDAWGNPVSGVTVTFTAPIGVVATANFSGGVSTAVTGSNGQATSVQISANNTAGSYNIAASASGTGSVNFAETNAPGAAAQVLITPSPTTASASATTNVALSIQLVDQYGNATTSASSTTLSMGSSSTKDFFTSSSGTSGTLNTAFTATIPANGTGSVTIYYGDETAATPTITAMNGASTWGTTTVRITAGTATTITATSGSGQSALVNANFLNPVVATVTDFFGNPVSGASVVFSGPSSGASATFASAATIAVLTNASGQASSGTFKANGSTGSYQISAAVTGLTSATFAETNTVGPPAAIAVAPGSPSSSGQIQVPGSAFTYPLSAKVTDAAGNPISGVTVTFTAPSSGASGTFTGGSRVVTAVTNSIGIATSTTFTANSTQGTFNVAATASGFSVNFVETNGYRVAISTSSSLVHSPGAKANITMTLQLLNESGGNVTSSGTTSINLNSTGGGGFATTSGNSTSSPVTVTFTNTGTVTEYFGDKSAETVTITATSTAAVAGTLLGSVTWTLT